MSVVPYDDGDSYKPSSAGEFAAFWKCMLKNGRIARTLLYLASSIFFIFLLAYVVQNTVDNALGSYSFPVFILPLLVLISFILYAPTMPKLYRVQFREKFRPGITEEEIRGLLTELAGRSLELISLIICVICILCIAVYEAAALFSLPDSATLIMLAVTAIDTVLVSLLLSSLGPYNRVFLRRTFTEDEYKRYMSLGNYRNIFIILIIVNVLAIILLFVAR